VIFSPHYVIRGIFATITCRLTTSSHPRWRAGQFPLWILIPTAACRSFANINAQIFYPPTAVTVFFANFFSPDRLTYFMELHLAVHVLLGGVFTFLLLREIDASRGCSADPAPPFSSAAPISLRRPNIWEPSMGAAWIPLACWSVVRLSKATFPPLDGHSGGQSRAFPFWRVFHPPAPRHCSACSF